MTMARQLQAVLGFIEDIVMITTCAALVEVGGTRARRAAGRDREWDFPHRLCHNGRLILSWLEISDG